MNLITHEFNDGNLVIKPTEAGIKELKALKEADELYHNVSFYDSLAELTENHGFDFVYPEETGDLTNAPMIGIVCGVGENGRNVSHRWLFQDYQTKSPLETLLVEGKLTLTGGRIGCFGEEVKMAVYQYDDGLVNIFLSVSNPDGTLERTLHKACTKDTIFTPSRRFALLNEMVAESKKHVTIDNEVSYYGLLDSQLAEKMPR